MTDRLKFGYFTLSDNSVGYGARRRDPGALIKEVVNQAIAAEELGYHSAWLPEHHFGFFGVLPTPAQALTFIAARTSRLRLAPATVLLPCTSHYVLPRNTRCSTCSATEGRSFPPGAATMSANTTDSRSLSPKAGCASTKSCSSSARRGPKITGPSPTASTTELPSPSPWSPSRFKNRIRQSTWRASASRPCAWPPSKVFPLSSPHSPRP